MYYMVHGITREYHQGPDLGGWSSRSYGCFNQLKSGLDFY